jgi:ABC-type sugar transport system permease subunit
VATTTISRTKTVTPERVVPSPRTPKEGGARPQPAPLPPRLARLAARLKPAASLEPRAIGLLFVLPVLLLLAAFRFYPMLDALWLSFHRKNLVDPVTWVGFGNYTRLFHDAAYLRSLRITAYFVGGTVLPLWVLSLGLALMFNRAMRGVTLFRALAYLPAIIPAVVVPVIWRYMLQPYGPVNEALNFFHLPSVAWLTDTRSVIPAFIMASEWRFIPLFAVIYFAGLQGIPHHYHEAAQIDGASTVRRFFSITLPLLRPTFVVVAILSLVMSANTVGMALLLTDGGPSGASRVAALYVYQLAFEDFNYGLASAASMVMLVAILLLTVLLLRLTRSEDSR